MKPNERNSLADLKDVELYYFENLHAKCYFNEEMMVITSMNMYEYSEVNNREMGVLIDRTKDKDLFERAVNETLSIIQSAEPVALKKTKRSIYNEDKKTTNAKQPKFKKVIRGYFIRCQTRIDYDPNRPF